MLDRTHQSVAALRHEPEPSRPSAPIDALRRLLTGSVSAPPELPALPDLVAGVIALATGTRSKVILPLGSVAAEYALVRRGGEVVVDGYGTEHIPEVLLLGRVVKLSDLLTTCAESCRAASAAARDTTTRAAFDRLAERVEAAEIVVDPLAERAPVRFSGGTIGSPGPEVPLAFGFHAQIVPSGDSLHDAAAFADVQALLFVGRLWAYSRGRRFVLVEGPVMLAAQRMLAVVRALVDAWQASRGAHVRLAGAGFGVAVRHSRDGEVSLTLSTHGGGSLTLPALDVASAALPILRLVSDLSRRLVAVDRRQAHNLRLAELKREVRSLRRVIRTREHLQSFENRDPDRLRLGASASHTGSSAPDADTVTPRRFRYTQRWSAEIDGLDASGIFVAGARLVVATPKLTLALSRRDGEVLWSQPTARASSLLCGEVLLRALPDGELELCDLTDGSVFARTHFVARSPGTLTGLFAGGGALPPMAILVEGRQRLVAVDLRTGQSRWDFRARGNGGFQLRRAGRVLLVTSGDASVHALDVATGEVVWRFSDRVRFCLAPAIAGETVVAAAGEPGGGSGAVYGIELYTGRLLWTRELPSAPSGAPIDAGGVAVIGHGRARNARITGLDARDGRKLWTQIDPGLDQGGFARLADGGLVVNAPSGRASCLDLERGEPRWVRALANPLTDDVPRQLDPVLCQGALFVPSAQLHVLNPTQGEPLTSIDCDLVPDFLSVDEHGHVYVAEESGHMRAYAPMAQLSLVR